jgi:hypothetical protein
LPLRARRRELDRRGSDTEGFGCRSTTTRPIRRPALERVKLAMMSKIRKLKRSIRAILNIAARTSKWGRRGRSGSPERVRPKSPVPLRGGQAKASAFARDGPSRSSGRLFGQLSAYGWLPAPPCGRAPGRFACKGMEASRAARGSAARRPQLGRRQSCTGFRALARAPFCRHDDQRPGGA